MLYAASKACDLEDSGLEPLTSCLQIRIIGFSRYR